MGEGMRLDILQTDRANTLFIVDRHQRFSRSLFRVPRSVSDKEILRASQRSRRLGGEGFVKKLTAEPQSSQRSRREIHNATCRSICDTDLRLRKELVLYKLAKDVTDQVMSFLDSLRVLTWDDYSDVAKGRDAPAVTAKQSNNFH